MFISKLILSESAAFLTERPEGHQSPGIRFLWSERIQINEMVWKIDSSIQR
jgi:hypothetical protein